MNMKEYTSAHADCKEVIKLNPNNKAYRDMFEKINTGKKAEAAKNKNAFGNMFSGGGMYDEKEDFVPRPDTDTLPAFNPENAQCFFDMTIGSGEQQRVVFEVFTQKVPKTGENFRSICAGDNDKGHCYKGNFFHRVIKGFMA